MNYKVSFTRKGKRLKTTTTFRKKSRANAYKDSLNKNLRNANARVIKVIKKVGKSTYDYFDKKTGGTIDIGSTGQTYTRSSYSRRNKYSSTRKYTKKRKR